jgi:hypothetical protein
VNILSIDKNREDRSSAARPLNAYSHLLLKFGLSVWRDAALTV